MNEDNRIEEISTKVSEIRNDIRDINNRLDIMATSQNLNHLEDQITTQFTQIHNRLDDIREKLGKKVNSRTFIYAILSLLGVGGGIAGTIIYILYLLLSA